MYNDAKTLEEFFDQMLEKWLPMYAFDETLRLQTTPITESVAAEEEEEEDEAEEEENNNTDSGGGSGPPPAKKSKKVVGE